MKILTLGDSFTYGDELSDRNSAWPNILSKYLNCEVSNQGLSGIGNSRIVRNCIELCNEYDLIIIAWSHFARIEFADQNGIYDIWPGTQLAQFDNRLNYRKDIIKYVTEHHDDVYLYRQYLINIILLQNYLKTKNKKYIMLDAFGNHQNIGRFKNIDLIDQIDTKVFLGWPLHSMMEWTYDCPKGPKGHFLEQGHKQVADKIYEYIRYLGWIS